MHQTVQSGKVLIPPPQPAFKTPFLLDGRSVLARPEAPSLFCFFYPALCWQAASPSAPPAFICLSFAFLLFHCLPCSAALALPPKASVYIYFLISPPLCFAIITLFYRRAFGPQTTGGSGLNIARGHYKITALQHLSCTSFSFYPLSRHFFWNIMQIIIMAACHRPGRGVDQRVTPSITASSWTQLDQLVDRVTD